MEVSAKELRGKPGQIIEQAMRGTDIVITLRGKKIARLIPYAKAKANVKDDNDEIFGMWVAHDEELGVDEYVREKRKGRTF